MNSITIDGQLGGSEATRLKLVAMSIVRHAASLFGFSQKKKPKDDLVAISKVAKIAKAAELGEIVVAIARFLNLKWLMPKVSSCCFASSGGTLKSRLQLFESDIEVGDS